MGDGRGGADPDEGVDRGRLEIGMGEVLQEGGRGVAGSEPADQVDPIPRRPGVGDIDAREDLRGELRRFPVDEQPGGGPTDLRVSAAEMGEDVARGPALVQTPEQIRSRLALEGGRGTQEPYGRGDRLLSLEPHEGFRRHHHDGRFRAVQEPEERRDRLPGPGCGQEGARVPDLGRVPGAERLEEGRNRLPGPPVFQDRQHPGVMVGIGERRDDLAGVLSGIEFVENAEQDAPVEPDAEEGGDGLAGAQVREGMGGGLLDVAVPVREELREERGRVRPPEPHERAAGVPPGLPRGGGREEGLEALGREGDAQADGRAEGGSADLLVRVHEEGEEGGAGPAEAVRGDLLQRLPLLLGRSGRAKRPGGQGVEVGGGQGRLAGNGEGGVEQVLERGGVGIDRELLLRLGVGLAEARREELPDAEEAEEVARAGGHLAVGVAFGALEVGPRGLA